MITKTRRMVWVVLGAVLMAAWPIYAQDSSGGPKPEVVRNGFGDIGGGLSEAPEILDILSGEQGFTVVWEPMDGETEDSAYKIGFFNQGLDSLGDDLDEVPDSDWTTLDVPRRWGGYPMAVVQDDTLRDGDLVAVRIQVADFSETDDPFGFGTIRELSTSDWSVWSEVEIEDHATAPAELEQLFANRDPPVEADGEATLLEDDMPVAGFIGEGGEEDWFSIWIDDPNDVARCWKVNAYGVEAQISVFNSDGETIRFRSLPGAAPFDESGVIVAHYDLDSDGDFVYLAISAPLDNGVPQAGGSYVIECDYIRETITSADPVELEHGNPEAVFFKASGDRDYYSFEVEAETPHMLITTAGGTGVDPLVRVLNDQHNVVYAQEDSFLVNASKHVVLVARDLSVGTYVLEIEHNYRQDGELTYVTAEPVEDAAVSSRAAAVEVTPTPLTDENGDVFAGVFASYEFSGYVKFAMEEAGYVLIRALSPYDRDVEPDMTVTSETGGFNFYSRTEYFKIDDGYLEARTLTGHLEAGTYFLQIIQRGEGVNSGEFWGTVTLDKHHGELIDRCSQLESDYDDPAYPCQWHLDSSFDPEVLVDINMEGVGDYTGDGISVLVSDDGLDGDHKDLAANIDSSRSYDVLTGETEVFGGTEAHGTQVAGLIGAVGDNNLGGRGVAPDSTLYGVNIIARATDQFIADSFTRHIESTSILNASWGIAGNHLPLSELPSIIVNALKGAVENGSGGNGTSIIKAAGNSGIIGDDANYEDIQTYPYVSAVCAVGANGAKTVYTEFGANLWVCGPSIGDLGKGIFTTDNYDRYTGSFGGTSAAAPIVSGVVALMREANASLTWRDVKLILASSAQKVDSVGGFWNDGAAKYEDSTESYSHSRVYGFGLVDATAAVGLAENWTNVPSEFNEVHSGVEAVDAELYPDGEDSETETASTINVSTEEIDFIEWIRVGVDLDVERLRSYTIELVSPSGRTSRMSIGALSLLIILELGETPNIVDLHPGAPEEKFYLGDAGFLGEDPNGEWTLVVTRTVDPEGSELIEAFGDDEWVDWDITFYGHSTSTSDSGDGGDEGEGGDEGGEGGDEGGEGDDEGGEGDDEDSVPDLTAPCEAGDQTLCLQDGRFEVTATHKSPWSSFLSHNDSSVQLVSDAAGVFSYDEDDEWILLVSLLDGCDFTGGLWLNIAETYRTPKPDEWSDQSSLLQHALPQWTVNIRDTATGVVDEISPGDEAVSATYVDTEYWPSVCASSSSLPVKVDSEEGRPMLVESASATDECPDGWVCLVNGRFQVKAEWKDFYGHPHRSSTVAGSSSSTGAFSFRVPSNIDLMVKMSDQCAPEALLKGYMVQIAASTNLGFVVTVRDTVKDKERQYRWWNNMGYPHDPNFASAAHTAGGALGYKVGENTEYGEILGDDNSKQFTFPCN